MTYQEEGQARLRRLRSKQAIILAMQGRWREAVEANQSLIESFPSDVDAYNRLGRAYMELGEHSRARETYSRAIELDPYNTIAEKNLRRLSHLGGVMIGSEGDAEEVDPRHFIEETGKAGVVNLHHLAPPEVLARMVAGDKVYLKISGANLVVEDGRGEYIGQVEPKHAQRLIKLMGGENKYTAAIISSKEDMVTVIIREVYQDPSQSGRLSFPPRDFETIRSYIGDRMLRRELESEEESAEGPGYTIIGDDGEVVLEEIPGVDDVDDKAESEE